MTPRRAPRIIPGPSPAWLEERLEIEVWSLEEHYLACIKGCVEYAEANEKAMTRLSRSRRLGLYLLLAAAVLYGVGMFIASGA